MESFKFVSKVWTKIGKYQDNCMEWFAMCNKLDQDQEIIISICSKQINGNYEREECQVLLYPYKRESSRPTE